MKGESIKKASLWQGAVARKQLLKAGLIAGVVIT